MNQRENKEELENRISSLNYAKSQEEEKRLEFFMNKHVAPSREVPEKEVVRALAFTRNVKQADDRMDIDESSVSGIRDQKG